MPFPYGEQKGIGMIHWLKRAAGWQRLWLLATMLAFAAGLFLAPPMIERVRLEQLAAGRARVVADFDHAECAPVRSTPYTQLAPVTEGARCYDIYVWRRNVTEKLPLIINNVLFPIDAHRREILFAGAMKGAAAAALFSALLFAALFALARRRVA